MCLIAIGEEAMRITDRHAEFAEAHPEILWRKIRRMRNRIAHDYFNIDVDLVWDTVQNDLPVLLEQLLAAGS